MRIVTPGTRKPIEVSQDFCVPYSPTKYPSNYKKITSFTLNWRTRLVFESVMRPTMFVTFTYDDEHYVENRVDERGLRWTLGRDFKLFVKRLRNNLERHHQVDYSDFNYYDITERGDDGRLHHHALIFGIPFKSFRSRNRKGQRIDNVVYDEFTQEIENSWGQGFVYFEAACKENINYVTKYLHKRMMSQDYTSVKGRGLGVSYLTDDRKEYFKTNKCTKIHIGKKVYFLPRYLKKKIFTDEELIEVNKLIEEENVKKIQSDIPADFNDNRHYVYFEKSDLLIKHIQNNVTRYKDRYHGYLNLCEIHSEFYDFVYEYDVGSDCLLAYPISDFYYWFKFKSRYFENLKMKTLFDRRL